MGASCRGGGGTRISCGYLPVLVAGDQGAWPPMGISPSASRVAWYRFRCTLRARWAGYLTLTLLLGLIGGLALGSVAGARRTQAAYSAYLAATNPSDITVLTGVWGKPRESGYDPAVIARIAALPGV